MITFQTIKWPAGLLIENHSERKKQRSQYTPLKGDLFGERCKPNWK
jgi:hypothetical protein